MTASRALIIIIVGALSLGAMTVLPRHNIQERLTAPVLDPVYAPALETIHTHNLAPGESLGMLLSRSAVVGPDLLSLLRTLTPLRDPTSLRPGVEITVRRYATTGEPRSVEVRVNPDTTIKLARVGAGWTSSVTVTPIVLDTMFLTGEIDQGGSLYLSLGMDTTLNLPYEERIALVSDLADIFEYQVDFLHEIQPGDRYSLAFERETRPDGTARSSGRRVLIARLETGGKRLDAIYFKAKQISGYYDLKGNALRRGFRRHPLDYVRITSSFAWKRYHPILGVYRAHLGTDFGAASGTPVKAVGAGTVTFAGREGGYGNVIMIRHGSGFTTRYAHLSRFAPGIRAGRHVDMGDVIGRVGMTGLATAPHLHYELRLNGRPVNYTNVKLPASPPLPREYRDQYRGLMQQRVALLEKAVLGTRVARLRANHPAVGGGM
jgi:murein DD-endopeptidase MepM/ murein hydrolase activator NlpD